MDTIDKFQVNENGAVFCKTVPIYILLHTPPNVTNIEVNCELSLVVAV